MHRKGFAVIPFVIVAAVTLIAATVVYRTSNQRQTTNSSASAISIASDINNTWSKVKPINNVFPWTDGGPTASWERYLPSINLNRLGVCNKKYCWVYDRATETWSSGFDMSTSEGFAVKPGPGNIYPWSNNGPTAAWTWLVKSNDPATFFNKPNGTDILETIICNKTICWRSIRYPGTPPAGTPENKWRDDGVGKDLHHLNSFWEDTRVAGLWTGDGLTSALTNPNTKEATLCNHSYCWTLNYTNWTWKERMTSFPVGVSELTSTWISQTTNWFYLCNSAKCWIKNASTGAYENNGNPVFLHNTPTPTWTPFPTTRPTATQAPSPTPRPTAIPTIDVLLNCVPRQTSPINNVVVNDPLILRWSTCPGVTHYQLQGSGGNYSVPTTTVTGSSYTLSGFALTPNATYTWSVRACASSSCSRVTAWAPNQSFRGPIPPTATSVPPLNLPIEVSTTKSNFYNIRITAIRSSAPTTAQPVVCLDSAATAAGTSGATTVTGTCNGLTRGETYRISIMALDKATETPLRPYTTSNYTAPATGSTPLRLTFTMPTPPTVTVAPTTRPTTIATQIPPTVIPTTPPSQRDATINFAVEYSGIASSKTLLPAAETQVRILQGATVIKTVNVALQRRGTSSIFAPSAPISVAVPTPNPSLVAVTYSIEVKHLTSTTLTVTGLALTPGQLSSFSPNGEGKLYGGDVNGFNACTNCSYGLIDSYDLNNFLEAYNANRVDNTVDFNRDGAVTLADFGLLAQNYNKGAQTINLGRTRDE